MLGICLMILFLFVCLVILPLFDKIKKSSQEYLSNQEILNKLDKREYLFKKLQKSYNEKDSDLLMVEKVFINQEETASFIFILEKLAKQTGNIFEIKTASSFSPSEKEKEMPFLALQFSIFGNFSNLLDFLSSLENNPYPPYRLIEIDGLIVKRLEQRNLVNLDPGLSEGDLETILGIQIYTQ